MALDLPSVDGGLGLAGAAAVGTFLVTIALIVLARAVRSPRARASPVGAAYTASSVAARGPRASAFPENSVVEVAGKTLRRPREVGLAEWTTLVGDVARAEGILAETHARVSKRQGLKALLAAIRDRDLLYARGERIGKQVYATSFGDLAERLMRHRVAADASFKRASDAPEAVVARLAGTRLTAESPAIGTCACYLEAGLLAGAISNLESRPYEVREFHCVARGDPYCEFRAIPREGVAASWVEDPAGLTGGGLA